MNAEKLITTFLEAKRGKVVKGKVLTGAEVAALAPKQGILINGKRATVLGVEKKGNQVELAYAAGAKSFSRDRYLIVQITDKTTPVQYYTRTDPTSGVAIYRGGKWVTDEAMTQGMKRAYAKRENKKVCGSCGTPVPKYPGRYPSKCPECGAEYES